VLIGMADSSREVRASAARSLSRLSFNRADAYFRVLETADGDMLIAVARACIEAGIVSQNLDRLTSNDQRQAHEAFALFCLLAKARMTDPILDAISRHASTDVRLGAIRLLAATGHPNVFEQLRELAVQDGISEQVKTALLEAMYKWEQSRQAEEEDHDEDFWFRGDKQPNETEESEFHSDLPPPMGPEFEFTGETRQDELKF
jgi:hypothetical protein